MRIWDGAPVAEAGSELGVREQPASYGAHGWRFGEEALLDLSAQGREATGRIVARFVAIRLAMVAAAGTDAASLAEEHRVALPYLAALAEQEPERSVLLRVAEAARQGAGRELVDALLSLGTLAAGRQEPFGAAAARNAAWRCALAAGDATAAAAVVRDLTVRN